MLSNSTRFGNAIHARQALPAEVDAALSILLSGPQIQASAEQVQGFLTLASHRDLNLEDLWVAVCDGQIHWAMLPVVSPGRTMLLLSPPLLPSDAWLEPLRIVTEAACEYHRQRGIQLAQLLIDPAQLPLRKAYCESKFIDLAELIYLQRTVRNVPSMALPPSTRKLFTYSENTHDLFIQTIARSYENSLDCPGLNGLRSMDDVLTGHKGAGDFDPALWFLLTENDQPAGVLLLGKVSHIDALELVYLGLVPEARGKGLADLLLNLALLSVLRQNRTELTLAVDARNAPAMKLYFRHGLRRIGSRTALIRDLAIEGATSDLKVNS